MSWTPERVERLLELHKVGNKSMAGMAAVLTSEFRDRITRNAVIGKLTRMGFGSSLAKPDGLKSNTETGNRRSRPRRTRTQHGSDVALSTRICVTAQHKIMEVFDTEVPDLPPDHSDFAVTFADLHESHCKYPLGDPADLSAFRYCGDTQRKDAPYCERHCRIAYTQPAERKPRSMWR